MNKTEESMVAVLKDLKEKHHVVELKTEFESEAARLNEVMRLKDVAEKAGLGLVIKTGGPEAVRDLYDAHLIGVTGIVAPMVESGYALKKYLLAIEKFVPEDLKDYIKFAVNIETNQACQNFDDILVTPGIGRLARIAIGRVDLSGSLGLDRNEINSEKVFDLTRTVFVKSKAKGFSTTMGGGIAKEALPFVEKLISEKLLDRYETRKIIFEIPPVFDRTNAEEGIVKANRFELLWLANKRDYYHHITKEDENRIKMLESRVKLD